MLFCYIISCELHPLLYRTNYYFSCIFHQQPMIRIKRRVIDCLCNWTFCLMPGFLFGDAKVSKKKDAMLMLMFFFPKKSVKSFFQRKVISSVR